MRIGLESYMFSSEHVYRAPNANCSPVEHMGVNHSRLGISMTQELVNRSDVAARFEETGNGP